MPSISQGLAVLTVVAVVLIVIAVRRARRPGPGSRALAFVAFFVLPVTITGLGVAAHLEHAKSTEFCLSCHVMEPYGRSLRVDDESWVAAVHFQNHLLPQGRECYTCHTTYTMYGDFEAKLRGLRHVYVQYLGTVPEKIELYEPYRNRECLSCHGGARRFEAEELHAEIRGELAADEVSCLDCHAPVHDVESLEGLALWPPEGEPPEDGR